MPWVLDSAREGVRMHWDPTQGSRDSWDRDPARLLFSKVNYRNLAVVLRKLNLSLRQRIDLKRLIRHFVKVEQRLNLVAEWAGTDRRN